MKKATTMHKVNVFASQCFQYMILWLCHAVKSYWYIFSNLNNVLQCLPIIICSKKPNEDQQIACVNTIYWIVHFGKLKIQKSYELIDNFYRMTFTAQHFIIIIISNRFRLTVSHSIRANDTWKTCPNHFCANKTAKISNGKWIRYVKLFS